MWRIRLAATYNMNQLFRSIIQHLPRLALAMGVSFITLSLLIILVSSGHSPAERPQILELLFNTAWSGVFLYLGLHIIAIFVRAVRYRILLTASGETSTPGLGHMILVTGFRNMMVDLLPARLGELGYVALLNRGYQVSIAACLSSLAIAVVFDFLGLMIIILLVILAHLFGSGVDQWLWGTFLLALTAVCVAVICLFTLLPWFNQKFEKLSTTRPEIKFLVKLSILIAQLDQAVQTTRKSGALLRVLLLSIVVRCLKYLSIFVLFLAVAGPSVPALANVLPIKIFAAILGAEIGASLPIPTFMGFGTYEAGGTLVFSLLGVSEQLGLLVLLGVHIWSQAFDYGFGGICLALAILLTRPKAFPASSKIKTTKSQWAFGLAGIVLISGILALGWQYRSNTKLGAIASPPIGEDLSPVLSQQKNTSSLAIEQSGLSGFITWSSNRFGNHDILKMTLPDGEISQLTQHPHTEYYPRISPDGKRVLFARSHQAWVSQRNTVAWDVILLDLETSSETPIASSATYPFWIDNSTVGYLQHGIQVMRQNLLTNQTSLIFRSGENNSLPPGEPITSPDIHPENDKLVFTAKQSVIGLNTGFWGTAIVSGDQANGSVYGILDGCELSWSSDGRWLYQVGHGGKQETMFYRIDPTTLESSPWLDLPGDYSHEYWPKDSNDGRYLIFGASRGEHEHDVADYELFLWEIDSPLEQVIRLTFHSGNDNWPDIFIQ